MGILVGLVRVLDHYLCEQRMRTGCRDAGRVVHQYGVRGVPGDDIALVGVAAADPRGRAVLASRERERAKSK